MEPGEVYVEVLPDGRKAFVREKRPQTRSSTFHLGAFFEAFTEPLWGVIGSLKVLIQGVTVSDKEENQTPHHSSRRRHRRRRHHRHQHTSHESISSSSIENSKNSQASSSLSPPSTTRAHSHKKNSSYARIPEEEAAQAQARRQEIMSHVRYIKAPPPPPSSPLRTQPTRSFHSHANSYVRDDDKNTRSGSDRGCGSRGQPSLHHYYDAEPRSRSNPAISQTQTPNEPPRKQNPNPSLS